MRGYQVGLLCIPVLAAGLLLTKAVTHPPESPAVSPVAAPLENIEFVEAKALSKNGAVITPREDSLVPRLMFDLLRDEEIARLYPWCSFEMVAAHPVWTWHTGLSSGIFEENGEALRLRLVDRLRKHGFVPLPETPDSVPQIHRTGDRPLKYRKVEQGCEFTIEFGDLMSWTGGRRPAVGIAIACIIRGTKTIATPNLSEVMAAVPTIAAPTHGRRTIPPAIIESLKSLPVTSAGLSGTGETWYMLTIATPEASLKDFKLQERIEAQLIAAGFEKDDTRKARSKEGMLLLEYTSHARQATSNCRISMEKVADECQIHLFVQP